MTQYLVIWHYTKIFYLVEGNADKKGDFDFGNPTLQDYGRGERWSEAESVLASSIQKSSVGDQIGKGPKWRTYDVERHNWRNRFIIHDRHTR